LFLIISLGLALVNRTPGGSGVEAAGRELSTEEAGTNWVEEEFNPNLELLPESEFLLEDVLQNYDTLPSDEILEGGAAE
jgi:hypothetical protein